MFTLSIPARSLHPSLNKVALVFAIVALLSACAQTTKPSGPTAMQVTADQIAQSCELMPESITGEREIGVFKVTNEIPGWIEFPGVTEDRSFDFDTLYKVEKGDEVAYFRTSEKNFIKGAMYLGGLTWQENKKIVTRGDLKFYAVSVNKQKPGKTMTMVGDSITWWSNGKYFRCLLSKQMSGVNFTGPHTDSFGYGHAGEGGNNTFEVLGRLDAVQPSDYYFLLAGTNDWTLATPEQSFDNIKKISKTLSDKGGEVIISTLLPRLDSNDNRNKKINSYLMAWGGQGCNCKVIDLYSEFSSSPEYKTMYWDEGIHPTIIGYRRIAEILAPKFQVEINSPAGAGELAKSR